MSLFNFGQKSATPANQSIPSFSLTGATPASTPSTQTQGAQPFSFGAQPAAGSNAPAQSAPGAPTTGLFGSTNTPAQPAAGSSLFGAKPATTTTGGLFGGTSSLFGGQQNQQPQQQQQQQGQQQPGQTSLFGQQPQTSSLFGQSTTQPQQQPQPSTSLFGQSTQQQPQQQQTHQSGLFGSVAQPQPQQGLQASTSANASSGPKRNTKFTDLPENAQKLIEQMDAHFKQQKEASSLGGEGLGRAIQQTSIDIRSAAEEYSAIAQGLISINAAREQLEVKIKAEINDAQSIFEIWSTFKSNDGRIGVSRSTALRDFPQEFFKKAADAMEDRVLRYKQSLSQLQRAITSLANSNEAPSAQAVAQTIHNHQNAILHLAARLEQLHFRLEGLKSAYADEFRERNNTMRSPFDIERERRGQPVAQR